MNSASGMQSTLKRTGGWLAQRVLTRFAYQVMNEFITDDLANLDVLNVCCSSKHRTGRSEEIESKQTMNARFQRNDLQILSPSGEPVAEAISESVAQHIVDALNERRALEIERDLAHVERTRQDPNARRISSAEMREIMAAKGVDISQLPPLAKSTRTTAGKMANVG